LNYPQLKGEWIPHAYDVETEAFDYEPDYDNIVISYYHAQSDCKFALKVLLPVLKRLCDEGYKFKAVGIGKGSCKTVSWEESLRIKRESTLYFSSISPIGCYGKSAVESLSMGIPTINRISETSLKQSGCDDYGSPFIKANDPAELYDVLKMVFKGEIDLKQVSVKSREYAIKYHSYDAVAVRLKRIFGEIIGEVL